MQKKKDFRNAHLSRKLQELLLIVPSTEKAIKLQLKGGKKRRKDAENDALNCLR